MKPKKKTTAYLKKVIEWCKTHRPQPDLELQGNDEILLTADNEDEARSIMAFIGHMVLEFAKEDGMKLEIN